MAISKQHINQRAGFLMGLMLLLFVGVITRLAYIQIKEGKKYNDLASQITEKIDTIYANKGNVYAADGNLLATSMFRYEIRMDVMTIHNSIFQKELPALAEELSKTLGESPTYYIRKIQAARQHGNRYLFIARNLTYPEYKKFKSFPLFKLGANKGGFIAIQKTVREHPLGKVAARTIGYADYRGRPGIEGAFANELKGKDGRRLKQKIAKGQWKPVNDENEVEPRDGKDIITTIDVNMQDIAHQELLAQLEKFDADHGTVVLMEVNTGEVRAIVNLGKAKNGGYYEKRNYAIYESHEPGSTFKLMSMMVALEDKKIDTASIIDIEDGTWLLHKRKIKDSSKKYKGKISAGKAFEISSNVGVSKLIYKSYKEHPEKFVKGLENMGLGKPLGLPIKGEGAPYIPHPDDKSWSGLSLAWMAHGYGVHLTPLQTLTFYNAVANNGEMVKPRFVKEIRYQNNPDEHVIFEKEVIKKKICSNKTLEEAKDMLRKVVKQGTATNIYSKDYALAGKTGTCQAQYWTDSLYYIASFAGFFPVEKPQYSCIVVIHKPTKNGYYGNIVAAPVFEKIARKVFTATPIEKTVESEEIIPENLKTEYNEFANKVNPNLNLVPNVKGMAGMDAVSLLENMGFKVRFSGTGVVISQSLTPGNKFNIGQTIHLKLT